LETTATVALAYLNARYKPADATKILRFIVTQKDSYGIWGSTQATVLSMKALLQSEGQSAGSDSSATIGVSINGKEVEEVEITPETSDVFRIIDLSEHVKIGANDVSVSLDSASRGSTNLYYQLVGSYYVPWEFENEFTEAEFDEPVGLEVNYDRTTLAVDDMVAVSVRMTYGLNRPAKFLIIDLGVPPGFAPVTLDLDKLLEDYPDKIMKYSSRSRQVTLYLKDIEAGEVMQFSYRMRAKNPVKAKTPRSTVYDYYNPKAGGVAEPITVRIV